MSHTNNLGADNGDDMVVPLVEHNEEHFAQNEMEFGGEEEDILLVSTEEFMIGLNQKREKRKENDDRKIVSTIDYIRKLASMSRTQAEIMMRPIREAFQEKELIIERREDAWKFAVDKLTTYQTIHEETENNVFQRDEEMEEIRARNADLESKVSSLQARIVELESESFGSRDEVGKVCEEFNIQSSDELLRALIQKITIELKHTETLLELQDLKTKNEQLRQEARAAMERLKELELKTRMLNEGKEEVERKLKVALDQAGQNTLMRRGEKSFSFSQDRSCQFQTTEERSFCPPQSTQVPTGMKIEPTRGIEKARAYASLTGEIVESEEGEDTQSKGNLLEGNWTSTPRAEARMKQGNEKESLLEQILLAQAVPEPKPFSASERSISLETFKHTFAMKYRTLPVYDQLMLLESKFLEGKALQVFKGIPAREKTSVEKTFRALAERLRVSVQDESRMAKTRFERLRMRQGQTIEEFCLELDAIAEKAFGRNSPEEISSTKTAKLLVAMGELSDDYQLRSLMEWQLREIPEERQYDECRKFATVLEKGKLEMQKSRTKEKTHNQQVKQPSMPAQRLPSFRQNLSEVSKKEEAQFPNPIGRGEKRVTFPSCGECDQLGYHLPTCSKAPTVSCYYCGGKGHYSIKCPKKLETPLEQRQGQTLAVEKLERRTAEAARGSGDIQIEIGKIGNTVMEFLIDSGSTISLISKTTWNKLVKENGKEWEKQITKSVPEIKRVVAANNTNIELLFEAKIETIMATRTRKIIYHIADVQRDNVILGTNAFCDMDITMNIGGSVRDISLTKTVRIKPSECKTVEVQVEGLVL
uniref:CCHC-type domain-containing protein n=1 Tax=Caenorhabditis japonica TaxID=281687 RepID=A0A8R1IND2_CAEJA